MRYQSTPVRCGPASLREALRVKGHTRTEDELAKLARTTVDGTRATGLIRAIRAILPGADAPRAFNERGDVAVLRLQACLRAGVPALLAVDNWDHWVAAVGFLGVDKVIIADPAHDELYLYYDPQELLDRWLSQDSSKCYYIVVF